MLESRITWCCTLRDHVMTLGSTWSGMRLAVFARAAACVVGGTLTVSKPPPDRKPWPESVWAGFQVAHQAGRPGSPQVMAGFCSVCRCGGRLLMAKLLGVTSYAIPAPPRMAHLPWPVGS